MNARPSLFLAVAACIGSVFAPFPVLAAPDGIRAQPPAIILKLDDFRPVKGEVHGLWRRTLDFLRERNIKASVGVIASKMEEASPACVAWMQAERASGRVEFWFHGWDHATWIDAAGQVRNEFAGRSAEEQRERFERGQEIAQRKLGWRFTTFGPPGGAPTASQDVATHAAMAANPSMAAWLYPTPLDPAGEATAAAGKIAVLDRVWAVNLEGGVGRPDFERFRAGYAKNAGRDFFVLQGHPMHWTPERFAEFVRIIDFLQAEGARFVLPTEFARARTAAGAMPAEKLGAGPSWRSALYPADWSPGFRDKAGRFLHDFSHAGYRGDGRPPPRVSGPVLDVTRPPFDADPTGRRDATAAIQAAIDEAGKRGGGVVYLPAGTYRVAPPGDTRAALWLRDPGVVLRGAGAGQTRILNDATAMRERAVIEISPRRAAAWNADGAATPGVVLAADLPGPTREIPVADVRAFRVGQAVVMRNDLTASFIARIGMAGHWQPGQSPNRTLAYYRRIEAIDPSRQVLTVDVPVRGFLFREDGARVVPVAGEMLREVGLEDFSIGMRAHADARLGEEDYKTPGTAAFDAHGAAAIRFSHVENGWARGLATFAPAGNPENVHLLSNGLTLRRSRFVMVTHCDLRFPQYRGGGGNGYLYTLNGQDCLVRDSLAQGGRHNYDLGTMTASGNVILDCVARDGALASDFHMYLSLANLFDNVTCDGDFLEARAFRPFGNPVHGVTTTQSVFWNIRGLRYAARPFLVDSHQFGDGYVIGTRGPASAVKSDDFVEGVGRGDSLEPRSLYLDQLVRRTAAAVPR